MKRLGLLSLLILCASMNSDMVWADEKSKTSKKVEAKVPAEESSLPKKKIKLPVKQPDETSKKAIDADQNQLPEDAPEFVADINDLIKTGKMTAISVMQAKVLSSKPGSIEVEITTGSLKGTKTECQLSSFTKGIKYGFKDDTDHLMAMMEGQASFTDKSDTDKKIANHVGKDVKIGIDGDACTYLELIP